MICTFYSYKGGVGRSMALANVADHLSRQGLRVLMIDFDLEAPGLEQFFFRPEEAERRDAVRRQTGLLDLLLAYKEAMSTAGGSGGFRELERFVVPIFPSRPGGGRLDLMPAGQRHTPDQLARYALALRSFDWQDFYFNWEGDLFFEWLRRSLLPGLYDLVLIDSRTGVTEMGGICGYQLADTIVMMCGANHQNVDGTASMLRDFRSQPVEDLRRGRALEIVVVPARVEQKDEALLAAFRTRFDQRFAALCPPRLGARGLALRDLAIPYDPQYAFEERVARGEEERRARQVLEQVFARLADVIALLAPPETPAEGPLARLAAQAGERLGTPVAPPPAPQPILADRPLAAPAAPSPVRVDPPRPAAAARYDETRRFARFDLLLAHAPQDTEQLAPLRSLLERHGVRLATDASAGAPTQEWHAHVGELLQSSDRLLLCLGAAGPTAALRALAERAQQRGPAPPQRHLLLLPGFTGAIPDLLPGSEVLDMHSDLVPADLIDRLKPAAAAAVRHEERCPWVGRAAYAEHQADLFFGRADETRRLLDAVLQHPGVLLDGPSGCGKTSLLQAGLLPALRRAESGWRLVTAPSLEAAGEALAPITGEAPVLLAIEAGGTPAPAGDAPLLPPALAARVRCLLVLARSDVASGWARRLPARPIPAYELGTPPARQVTLSPPRGLALRQLIERPADAGGLSFEPGLVDRLVGRSEHEPGALPFLQDALVALWRQRRDGWLTNTAYDQFGGLRGLVIAAAQRWHEGRPEAARADERALLLRLVRVDDGIARPTPQRAPLADLRELCGAAPGLLDDLLAQRLLVAGAGDDGRPEAELAHESLAREWPPLLAWLQEEREFLAWRARLESSLRAWESGHASLLAGTELAEAQRLAAERGAVLTPREREFIGRSAAQGERSRQARLRWMGAVAAVLAVVSVVAIYGWQQNLSQRHVLAAQALQMEQQLDDLKQALAQSGRLQQETTGRLGELKQTLDQTLAAATKAEAEREQAQRLAADLRRAIEQAGAATRAQQAYSDNNNTVLQRQQDLLTKSMKK